MLATVIMGVSAVPAAADSFSCRASTARVAALGLTVEPFVANRPDVPCKDDSASLVPPTTVGIPGTATVGATVINARTDADPGGNPGALAEAQAVFARVAVSGLPVITADVLHTRVAARCVAGSPVFEDSSVVANVRIGSTLIAVPNGNAIVTHNILGLATVYINERVASGNRVTRRALRVRTLLGVEVVVAESTANVEGNPCAPPAKPECSDGVDNADPEDTLIDDKDPGCLSGPGGAYDPNDNDETDPPAKPECSDGVDNADPEDTLVDDKDPGCLSGPGGAYDPNDNDETDPPAKLPECSNGVDDADKEDSLADEKDPGCLSGPKGTYNPDDNDETDPPKK